VNSSQTAVTRNSSLSLNEHDRRIKSFPAAPIVRWLKRFATNLPAIWDGPRRRDSRTGEFNFQIEENVRGADVFIVQPTCPPVDSHLMELLVQLDAFRRSCVSTRCSAAVTTN